MKNEDRYHVFFFVSVCVGMDLKTLKTTCVGTDHKWSTIQVCITTMIDFVSPAERVFESVAEPPKH